MADDVTDREIVENPVGVLAKHMFSSGAVGTYEDRLAYSLDRCGLVLVTEQRLAALVCSHNAASAIEARRAETHSGSVHESAGRKASHNWRFP